MPSMSKQAWCEPDENELVRTRLRRNEHGFPPCGKLTRFTTGDRRHVIPFEVNRHFGPLDRLPAKIALLPIVSLPTARAGALVGDAGNADLWLRTLHDA